MVSRTEFEKNQDIWGQAQQAINNATGTRIGSEAGVLLNDFIGGSGQGLRDPENPDRYSLLYQAAASVQQGSVGGAGGPGLQASGGFGAASRGIGAAVKDLGRAGFRDDVARLTHTAGIKVGLNDAELAAARAQATKIIQTYEAKGPITTVEMSNAADKGIFSQLVKSKGMPASEAGALSRNTVNKVLKVPLAKPATTVAATTSRMGQYSDMLKSISKNPLAQYGIGVLSTISTIYMLDFLQGVTDLKDARVNNAVQFYVNGELTKEQFDKEIDDTGLSAEVTQASKNLGYSALDKYNFNAQEAADVGYERLPNETNAEFSTRYQAQLRQDAEKAFAEKQKANDPALKQQQREQIKQQTAPQAATAGNFIQQGVFSQAEANRVGVGASYQSNQDRMNASNDELGLARSGQTLTPEEVAAMEAKTAANRAAAGAVSQPSKAPGQVGLPTSVLPKLPGPASPGPQVNNVPGIPPRRFFNEKTGQWEVIM